MDFKDFCWIFYPMAVGSTHFSKAHWTLSKMNSNLDHKLSLNYKKFKITSHILSDHNCIKLKIGIKNNHRNDKSCGDQIIHSREINGQWKTREETGKKNPVRIKLKWKQKLTRTFGIWKGNSRREAHRCECLH